MNFQNRILLVLVFLMIPLQSHGTSDVHMFFQIKNNSSTSLQILGDGYDCAGDSPGIEIKPGKTGTVCGQYINSVFDGHGGDDHFRICPMKEKWNPECLVESEHFPSFFVKNKTLHLNGSLVFVRSFDTSFHHGSAAPNTTVGRIENFQVGQFEKEKGQDFASTFQFYEYPHLSLENQFFVSMMDQFPDFNIFFMDSEKKHPISFQTFYKEAVNSNGDLTPLLGNTGWHFDSKYPIEPQEITLSFDEPYQYRKTDFTFEPSRIKYGSETKYLGFFPDFINQVIHVSLKKKFLPYGFYEIVKQTVQKKFVEDLLFTDGQGEFCSFVNIPHGLQMFHDFGGGATEAQIFNDDRNALVTIDNRVNQEIYDEFFKGKFFRSCRLPSAPKPQFNLRGKAQGKKISEKLKTSTPSEILEGPYEDEWDHLYFISQNSYCSYTNLQSYFNKKNLSSDENKFYKIADYKFIHEAHIKTLKNMGICNFQKAIVQRLGYSPFLGIGNYYVEIPLKSIDSSCTFQHKNLILKNVYYDEHEQFRTDNLAGSQEYIFITSDGKHLEKFKDSPFDTYGYNNNAISQTITLANREAQKMCLANESLVIYKAHPSLNFFVVLQETGTDAH